MIDLEALARNFHDPLKAYCGIPQIIGADQDIPECQIIYPRLAWKITSHYIPEAAHPVFCHKAVSGTINPEDFPKDVQVTAIMNPEAVFSFTFYGKPGKSNNSVIVQKAREWFAVKFLGPEFLSRFDVVVVDVTEIQNRSTLLEFDREDRRGFDVRFRFNEKVSMVLASVEEIHDQGTVYE